MRKILCVLFSIASTAQAVVSFGDPIMASDPWDVLDRVDPEITVDGDAVYVIWSEFGDHSGIRVNYSSDGGYNWDSSQVINDEGLSGELRGNPDVVIGLDDYVYGFFGAGDQNDMNIWVNRSPPGAPSWGSSETEIGGGGDDTRPYAAVSPTTGRLACVYWYDRYAVYCAYSDDNGVNWSTPVRVDDDIDITYSPDITVDDDGRFYVAWSEDTGTGFDRRVRVSYSDDAVNWSSPVTIADPDPGYSTNVNIGAAGDGIVCCAFRDTRNGGDWDIYANISVDSGLSWLPDAIMIYDAPSDFADRPAVSVSGNGDFYVTFEAYDGAEKVVFIADSSDGSNWDTARVYPGGAEYQGLPDVEVRDGGEVFVVWRSFEAYTSSIYMARTGSTGIDGGDEDEPATPAGFSLGNAHPNPSHGNARISFALPAACNVALDVFDIKGRKMATPAEGRYEPGNYQVIISDLDSGIYLYRFQADEFSDTKKMMVE
ncbi:MAG: T9SS type A sorting domain-containing protein [bacterium]|nr:T9SS type A sorting domain-containing protein [bacterium]